MMTKSSDGVTKIRPSPQHGVHERAKGSLVGLGVHLRGHKFDEVFVGKCWGGDGVRVRHPVMLEDLLNKLLLGQGKGAFLTVPGDSDAQDPSHFAKIGHLIKLTKGLLILEDSFEAF